MATTTRKTATSKTATSKPKPTREPLDGIGAVVEMETLAAALGLSKAFARRQCAEGKWPHLEIPRRGGIRFAFTTEHVTEIVASMSRESKRRR